MSPVLYYVNFLLVLYVCLSLDLYRVADALENLCHTAINHHIEKWVLVIPLIHLLRGESKPFEPVTPVLNPQSESWRGLRGIKGSSYAQ